MNLAISLSGTRRIHGMALIVVLWTVAIMAIMAGSLSRSLRNEIRVVGHAKSDVHALAIANAAMQTVARDLLAQADRSGRTQVRTVDVQEQSIAVRVLPLAGLIDLNSAGESLLANMMQHAGQVPADTAQVLAKRVVAYRERRLGSGLAGRFAALDEMTAVEGVSYELYARVRPLLTVDRGAGRGVNLLAADVPVLAVLAKGNVAEATRYASQRDGGGSIIDATAFAQEFLDTATSTRMKMQVTLQLPDQAKLQVSRMFDLNANAARGVPWEAYPFQIVRVGSAGRSTAKE